MGTRNRCLRQLSLTIKPDQVIDLAGHKYGQWTVLKRVENRGKGTRWLCRCACGTTRDVSGKRLKRGRTQSCGCSKREGDPEQCGVGQRYGRLVVTQRADSGYWLCRCDCGETKEVSFKEIKRGDTRSCGCLGKSGGGSTQLPEGESALNQVCWNLERNAERRRISCSLKRATVRKLATKPCHYCGKPPEPEKPNGIDRVDNTKGYLPDNVVPCCGKCNLAKNRMTVDEFMEWVERIYRHQFLQGNSA